LALPSAVRSVSHAEPVRASAVGLACTRTAGRCPPLYDQPNAFELRDSLRHARLGEFRTLGSGMCPSKRQRHNRRIGRVRLL